MVTNEEILSVMNLFNNVNETTSLDDIKKLIFSYGNKEKHVPLHKLLFSILLKSSPLETNYFWFVLKKIEWNVIDWWVVVHHIWSTIDYWIETKNLYNELEAHDIINTCQKIDWMKWMLKDILFQYWTELPEETKELIETKINKYHEKYIQSVAKESVYSKFPEAEKNEFEDWYVNRNAA